MVRKHLYVVELPCGLTGLAVVITMQKPGGVAERPIASVLKTDNPKGFAGSNPAPSADVALTLRLCCSRVVLAGRGDVPKRRSDDGSVHTHRTEDGWPPAFASCVERGMPP